MLAPPSAHLGGVDRIPPTARSCLGIQIVSRQRERHKATIRTRVREPEILEIPYHAKLASGHILWC